MVSSATADAPSTIHPTPPSAAAPLDRSESVWKLPSNGSPEATTAVMGDPIWPSLSDIAKASPKSSSSESLTALSDAPISAPTGSSPSPVNNPNPVKPMKPMPLEIKADKQASPRPSPNAAGFQPKPHGGNDNHRSYGGNRRGNNVGGGWQNNNYRNRRDPVRGGYQWNNRNNSVRGVHMQPPPPPPPPQGMRPFLRMPPPMTPSFMTPHIGSFAPTMGYPDVPSSPMYFVSAPLPPEAFRGVPFVAPPPPPPPMFFPVVDPQRAELLKQIEYYFSPQNLCKDIFLRNNMDGQGWVPISLIAGFKKVMELTNNIHYIFDTLRSSAIVEVQGGKIRSRNDWNKWILPPAANQSSNSGPQSPVSLNSDTLEARLQGIVLEEATNQNSTTGPPTSSEVVITISASGNVHD